MAETWTLYYITFGADPRPTYVGITTQPEKRLDWHIEASRRAPGLYQQAITPRIQAEAVHGREPHLKVLADGLDREQAKEAEVKTIRGLLRAGIVLENANLLGPVVNRHPRGTPEHGEAQRAYHRQLRATPKDAKGQARVTGHDALTRLRSGGALTPTRIGHITTAGPDFIEKAHAILAERGEQWPC